MRKSLNIFSVYHRVASAPDEDTPEPVDDALDECLSLEREDAFTTLMKESFALADPEEVARDIQRIRNRQRQKHLFYRLAAAAVFIGIISLLFFGDFDLRGGVERGDIAQGSHYDKTIDYSYVIWSVAFSPDGKWLATGSDDMTAKIWDLKTGHAISFCSYDHSGERLVKPHNAGGEDTFIYNEGWSSTHLSNSTDWDITSKSNTWGGQFYKNSFYPNSIKDLKPANPGQISIPSLDLNGADLSNISTILNLEHSFFGGFICLGFPSRGYHTSEEGGGSPHSNTHMNTANALVLQHMASAQQNNLGNNYYYPDINSDWLSENISKERSVRCDSLGAFQIVAVAMNRAKRLAIKTFLGATIWNEPDSLEFSNTSAFNEGMKGIANDRFGYINKGEFILKATIKDKAQPEKSSLTEKQALTFIIPTQNLNDRKFKITLKNSTDNNTVYQEEQVVTNQNGLGEVKIGLGKILVGKYENLDWTNDYSLKIEVYDDVNNAFLLLEENYLWKKMFWF